LGAVIFQVNYLGDDLLELSGYLGGNRNCLAAAETLRSYVYPQSMLRQPSDSRGSSSPVSWPKATSKCCPLFVLICQQQ
jgi:hypothetical protein